jgi:tetratricopeptide (TPR) repeat protein
VGDYVSTIETLQAYLLDFKRYQTAKSYLGPVHFNLGLAYRRRKDNLRALHHYHQALEWFSERGKTAQAGKTHQNIAWLFCLENDPDKAESEIELAETFSEVSGPEFMTEQLLCRAFVHILRKEVKQAVALAAEVLLPGRPGATDSHRANANWLAGTAALAVYHLEGDSAFADFAVEYSIRAKDTAAMSLASQLKSEVIRRKASRDEAAG